jgi:ATP-dependent Clp protease ATP-binding subunit ClpX
LNRIGVHGLAFQLLSARLAFLWLSMTPSRGKPDRSPEFKPKRKTTCSFCGKSSDDAGPMAEGPSDVYICGNCARLATDIINDEVDREKRSRGGLN